MGRGLTPFTRKHHRGTHLLGMSGEWERSGSKGVYNMKSGLLRRTIISDRLQGIIDDIYATSL